MSEVTPFDLPASINCNDSTIAHGDPAIINYATFCVHGNNCATKDKQIGAPRGPPTLRQTGQGQKDRDENQGE
jgi:hypothetical protein